MVIFFQSDCIRANWLFSMNDKVVVIRAKVVVFEKKMGCIQAKCLYLGKLVVFGQKWLYSGKSGSFRAKVLLYSDKMVVFGEKLLYSGKSGCIWTRWLYWDKVVVLG